MFAIDGDAYLARPGPSLLPGCATVAAATWYHDAGRMARLAATGHLPPEGSTWGRVDLSAAPDEAPEATPAHQDGAPGPASADAPGTPAERAPEGSGAAHSVSTAALVGDIEDRPTGAAPVPCATSTTGGLLYCISPRVACLAAPQASCMCLLRA